MVRAASGLRTVRLWSVRYASSCWRTAVSVVFDQKERMKKGRKFFQIIWAKRHYPRAGFTTTVVLKVDEKVPHNRGDIVGVDNRFN